MINWFCQGERRVVKDLQLSVKDVVSPSKVQSIPGEAIEADLTVLRGFFTDDAWKMVLMLG